MTIHKTKTTAGASAPLSSPASPVEPVITYHVIDNDTGYAVAANLIADHAREYIERDLSRYYFTRQCEPRCAGRHRQFDALR